MHNIESVVKATQIIEQLLTEEEPLGVRKLAELTGLPRNTVYRVLQTLEAQEWVVQDEESKKYRVSFRILGMGRRWYFDNELVRVSTPVLKELGDTTGQTAVLSILDDWQFGLCINKYEARTAIKLVSVVGKRIPLHAGATGKALLAFAPSWVQKLILENELEMYTPHTICKKEALEKELEQIRRKGVAISVEEVDPGAAAVGVPILDGRGGLVGGISVAGPRFEFEGKWDGFIDCVKQAADAIAGQLG